VSATEPAAEPPVDSPVRPERRRVGSLVLLATGDGKGKSTAAFGTALRARARNWPVAIVQFLKSDDWHVGEEPMLKQLGVDWFAAGDGFTWDSDDLDQTRARAQAAWRFAAELIAAGAHRLVILDEITYACVWGWIDTADVVAAVKGRPDDVHVFITGRDAPAELIAIADTATEMRKLAHAYDTGVMAIKGIDF
jgi:cob(I)alamin adenosyltransferase